MLQPKQIAEQLFLEDKDQMYLQFLDMQQELMLQHIMIIYLQLQLQKITTTLVM